MLNNDPGMHPEASLELLQPFDIECINLQDVAKCLLLYSRCLRELYHQNKQITLALIEAQKTIKELELQACSDVGL